MMRGYLEEQFHLKKYVLLRMQEDKLETVADIYQGKYKEFSVINPEGSIKIVQTPESEIERYESYIYNNFENESL